jgi:hypothetical protein
MALGLEIPETGIRIESTTYALSTLIDEILSGKICLPIFQRDFVWDVKQVRDLFESIIYNHPIGVIILWQPPKEALESGKIPYVCFDDEVRLGKAPEFLVLDGNQRLTSLLLAVRGWKIKRLGKDIEINPICIYRRGSRIDLTICNEKSKEGRCAVCIDDIIAAFKLYDEKALQKLSKLSEDMRRDLRKVAIAVSEYKVPIYRYTTTNISEDIAIAISESFIRINKTGTRIGNVELLVSLIISILTRRKSDIGNLIWNKYNDARKYGIDPTIYNRLLIKLVGLKQTDIARIPLRKLKALEERIQKVSVNEFSRKLDTLEKAIELTYQFFNKVLNLKSFEALPSHIALVPVVYYVYTKVSKGQGLEDDEFMKLLSWYVLVSIRGIFSGSGVDSVLERALKLAEEGIDSMFNKIEQLQSRRKVRIEDIRISKEELIRKFKGRGKGVVSDAAKFLLKTLLTLNKADDWSGRLIDFSNYDLELHHIFPRGTDERVDSIANLTFISKTINRGVQNKQPIEYVFEELKLFPDVLKKHFMPTEKEHYTDFEKFINERASIIISEGKKLLPDLFK